MGSGVELADAGFLADKPKQNGQPTGYVCQAFASSAPVHTAVDLRKIRSEPLPT